MPWTRRASAQRNTLGQSGRVERSRSRGSTTTPLARAIAGHTHHRQGQCGRRRNADDRGIGRTRTVLSRSDAPLVAALPTHRCDHSGQGQPDRIRHTTSPMECLGYSSLGGQVINPYDASQTPSGSSSGPAVAAAGRIRGRRRSVPRHRAPFSARRPPIPMWESSRLSDWSVEPGSCRSRPARIRPGRSRVRLPTRRPY